MPFVILKLFKVWKPLLLKINKTHASSFACPSKPSAFAYTINRSSFAFTPTLQATLPSSPPWRPVCPAMHTTLCQHWRPQTSGVVS
jgi:hypothetical protein